MLYQPDIAKLLARLSLGVLLLFHGVHKLIYGIAGVKAMVASSIFAEFFAYGVYVGELIAPIFVIIGLYARFASAIIAVNMAVAIYLAYGFSITLGKHGGLAWELPLLYLILSILVILLGSGRFAVNNK